MHSNPKTYVTIYSLLLTCTALTIAAAYVDVGGWQVVVALVIATLKATLVILYFMHVKSSGRITQVYAGVGFIWLSILIGLTMADVLERN